MDEIEFNGKNYILKELCDCANEDDFSDMPYVIIRTYSAGVFAGYLEERDGKEVKLRQARRIWMWEGAATLSELAVEGTLKPKECRIPCAVDTIILTEAVEILPVTPKAKKSILSVPVWSAKNE